MGHEDGVELMLRFDDGVTFDTSGPLRIERKHDGLYVVGGGWMIAVSSMEEGKKIIEKFGGSYDADRK